MSENAPDRRVRRTQTALAEALLALLQRHDWDAISVQMICDRADVARASFYAHFGNKAVLMDHLFAVNTGELRSMIRAAPRMPNDVVTLRWLAEHIAEGRAFHRKTLQSASGQLLLSRFKISVAEILTEELLSLNPDADATALDFAMGGAFAVISDWALRGGPESTAQITAKVTRLTWRALGRDLDAAGELTVPAR